jgi:hypothetical protein
MALAKKKDQQLHLLDFPQADRKKNPKQQPPQTTAQQLGSIVKSARDIMRKDKGLNGDLDRLPMLTWIMFLKFLDDMEQIREEEAILEGKRSARPLSLPTAGETGRRKKRVLRVMS